MRKSCTQHEKVYLGGQYYVMGHPNQDGLEGRAYELSGISHLWM